MTKKTRANLQNEINTLLADNDTGDIGAADVRDTSTDTIDSAVFFEDPPAQFGVSTGWISGGEVTINADTTKFDIAAGSGVIVDASNPASITYTKVTWTAKTAVTATYLATNIGTFLAIDSGGNVVQSTTFPVGGNLRNYIQLGGLAHPNNTNITGKSDFISAPPFQIAPSLTDLIVAIGVINTSGNVISGAPAGNLKFAKSAGGSFYFGLNAKVSPNGTPNNTVDAALSSPQIAFSWRDGVGGFNTRLHDAIVNGVYDDNSGGDVNGPTGVVTTNNWVNARIKYSPDVHQIAIEYGDTVHSTSADAVAARLTDGYGDNPSIAGFPTRAYLSLRGAASNMTLTADAVFTQANKFGE